MGQEHGLGGKDVFGGFSYIVGKKYLPGVNKLVGHPQLVRREAQKFPVSFAFCPFLRSTTRRA